MNINLNTYTIYGEDMYNLNVFLIYSVLGNIFERILMNIRHVDYVSGFMGTIFTPLYGIAILIILFIHKKIKINNNILKILVEFIIFLLVLSFLEIISGLLILNIFNKVYWNYDRMKYNIGKYISLETGILWGIMGLIAVYIIHPIINVLIKYTPKIVTIILSIIFIINLIYVLIVKLT